jgi:dUTP pyrophosphatase
MNTLQVMKIDKSAKLPTRRGDTSSGYDLYSLSHNTIPPKSSRLVSTGIAISMPIINGFKTVGIIKSTYGLTSKKNAELESGFIDSSYTGKIQVILHNHSNVDIEIKKHAIIAQLLIVPVVNPEVEEVK